MADYDDSGHARLARLLYRRDPTPEDRVGHDAADKIEFLRGEIQAAGEDRRQVVARLDRVREERNRLRLVVAALDEIRGEVLHGGPVTRTPNEVLDLIDRATAHLEAPRG